MELINDSCPQLLAGGAIVRCAFPPFSSLTHPLRTLQNLLKCLASPTTIYSLARTCRLHLHRLQADPALSQSFKEGARSKRTSFSPTLPASSTRMDTLQLGFGSDRYFEAARGQKNVELKQKSEETSAPSMTTAPTEAKETPVQRPRKWAEERRVEIMLEYEEEGEKSVAGAQVPAASGREGVCRGRDRA